MFSFLIPSLLKLSTSLSKLFAAIFVASSALFDSPLMSTLMLIIFGLSEAIPSPLTAMIPLGLSTDFSILFSPGIPTLRSLKSMERGPTCSAPMISIVAKIITTSTGACFFICSRLIHIRIG